MKYRFNVTDDNDNEQDFNCTLLLLCTTVPLLFLKEAIKPYINAINNKDELKKAAVLRFADFSHVSYV